MPCLEVQGTYDWVITVLISQLKTISTQGPTWVIATVLETVISASKYPGPPGGCRQSFLFITDWYEMAHGLGLRIARRGAL